MAAADDGGPQPTAHDHEVLPGCSLDRRTFVKSSAALAALAAGGAASSGTVAAEDDPEWWEHPDVEGGVSPISAGEAAAKWAYSGAKGLFSSGYKKDDVEGMVADNQHWELFESIQSAQSLLDGFHVQSENWTVPSDPTASALADMVWGEARAYTFTQIEEQGDNLNEQDVVDGAIAEANELLSTVAKNYIRQWNEFIWVIYRHVLTFDQGSTETFEQDPNHVDGETFDGSSITFDIGTTPEGLDPSNVFYSGDTAALPQDIQKQNYTLPNGEEHVDYGFSFSESSTQLVFLSDLSYGANSGEPFEVESPDGDRITVLQSAGSESEAQQLDWGQLLYSVEEVETQVNGGELETYISDVLTEVRQENLDPIEILSPSDYAREFGDSGGLTRLDAEMAALGMQSPSDVSVDRTLSWTDADGNSKNASGAPYLKWNWTTLEQWEYSYDVDNHILTVDTDSISEDGVITLTYDDTDSTTVDVDMNNLSDDGTIDVSDSAPSDAVLASDPAIDLAGELNSFWPQGETITVGDTGAAKSLILGYENSNGEFVREYITGDVTLEDAGDGKDRMQISGYNTQTRDPARSLELAKYYEQQREDTTDLETSDPLGISAPDNLLGGNLAGIAIIGAVLLFVFGAVTDLIPGIGN